MTIFIVIEYGLVAKLNYDDVADDFAKKAKRIDL